MSYRSFLAILMGMCVPSYTHAQPPTSELSKHEQHRLDHGDLVSRHLTESSRGQRLVGGVSWQKIAAPAETVWRTALDVSVYPSLFPQLSSAEIISRNEHVHTVAMHHQHGPFDVRYTLEFNAQPKTHDLRFRLLSSQHDMIKALWGFMTVISLGPHESLLCYGVMGDVGSGSIQSWARPYLQAKLLRVPHYLKRHLERSSHLH